MNDVLRRLQEDPHAEPLVEAISDAAHLSAALAGVVEPSQEPRYLRLASWRDSWGRRGWKTERVAEAIAWGATLDRVRRFGGWKIVADRALRIVPEAVPSHGLKAAFWRSVLTVRHAAFVGALTAGHFVAVPEKLEGGRRRRLVAGG